MQTQREAASGHVRLSRLLSFVLRHRPEAYGVVLDPAGWVNIDALVAALAGRHVEISREAVLEVARTNDKRRFAVSDDGARIRANQGHSHPVELGYPPSVPPPVLFHGTVEKALAGIRRSGLLPRGRQHVHLSATVAEAERVGRRRGQPVILEVLTAEMVAAGHVFRCAPNAVWLTDAVPPEFLRFPG